MKVRYSNYMDAIKQPDGKYPSTVRGLAKQIGLHIVRSSQFLLPRLHQEVLTQSQAFALHLLLDNRAWRVSDLAYAAGVRLPSMTSLISRMERQGWICKTETAHDRRGVAVTITEEGRALIHGFERRNVDIIAQRLALLSDEEKVAIECALPALNRLFNSQEEFTH
jgi:DNA-binding MarR family transcriptional regulator